MFHLLTKEPIVCYDEEYIEKLSKLIHYTPTEILALLNRFAKTQILNWNRQ